MQKQPESKWDKKRELGIRELLIVLLIAVGAIGFTVYQNRSAYAATWQDAEHQARLEAAKPKAKQDRVKVEVACEQAIKEQLLTPTTAKFPGNFNPDRPEAQFLADDGLWQYVVSVTAENAFSAAVTDTFNCVMDDQTGLITVLEPSS